MFLINQWIYQLELLKQASVIQKETCYCNEKHNKTGLEKFRQDSYRMTIRVNISNQYNQ